MTAFSRACLIGLFALGGCAVGPMRLRATSPSNAISNVSSQASTGTAVEVSPQHMDVRFKRSMVTKIVHDPLEGLPYPDLITLEGRESPERCLVLEVTPDSLLARIPRQAEPTAARKPGAWLHGAGKLRGRVVTRRRPRAGCEVRLTFLRHETFLGVFSQNTPTERVLFETTGKEGRFLFEDLPPGPYRLAFMPPGGTHWLIRLREVPVDAVLAPGETFDVGRIDLAKRRLD